MSYNWPPLNMIESNRWFPNVRMDTVMNASEHYPRLEIFTCARIEKWIRGWFPRTWETTLKMVCGSWFNGGSAGSIWDPRYSINSWIFWSSPISKYSINISIFPNRFWTVLERFPPVKPPKKLIFFSRASRAISPKAPEFWGTLLIFPKNSLNFKVLY